MKEALFYRQLKDNKVQCGLCAHFCLIEDAKRGLCGVRENQGGRLFTLVYDRVAAANLDPVEKKPLYHFMPGTMTFSFAAPGCNMSCSFCQNWSLSQTPRDSGRIPGHEASAQGLVAAALDERAASISYTYSEPTIFYELMADTARLALTKGLKNILVSNGFASPEAAQGMAGFIQAANIDLKAFSETFYKEQCGARLAPVLETLKILKKAGVWVEVTTLVIPGLNDDAAELAKLASFIARDLGPETPWHLSRFHPDHKLLDRGATPLATLDAAREMGQAAGLKYVYVGNVPGDKGNRTYCPSCHAVVIDRVGFAIKSMNLKGTACGECGGKVDVVVGE